MLVFKYSRNGEPDNNSATTESIQPSADGDMSKKGRGGRGGRRGVVREREYLKMKNFIPCWNLSSMQDTALMLNSIALRVVLCIKDVHTETPSVMPQLDSNAPGPDLFGPAKSLLLKLV